MPEIISNPINSENELNSDIIFEDDVIIKKKLSRRNKLTEEDINILSKNVINTIWLSISEAAKIGGVQNKTVRRAILSKTLKYKIVGNRYLVDFASFIRFLCTTTKLKNKLNQNGIGQYIDIWRD